MWLIALYLTPVKAQVCNDLSLVALNDFCSATITPDMVLEGSADDSAYAVQLFTSKGVPIGQVLTAAHLGDTVRAVVTHLPSGNTCWGRLVPVDARPPTMSCPSLTVPCVLPDYSPAFLFLEAALSAAYPAVSDACGPPSLTFTDSTEAFNCSPLGLVARIWRTWVATDAAGNSAVCTQTLEVMRFPLDSLLFPVDTILECNGLFPSPSTSGMPVVFFNQKKWPIPSTASACRWSVVHQDHTVPLCGGSFALLRQWTVFDDCASLGTNNPIQGVQTIQVKDQEGPKLVCPRDTVLSTDPFACSRLWVLPPGRLADACSGVRDVEARWAVGGIAQRLVGAVTATGSGDPPDTIGSWSQQVLLPSGETTVLTYLASDSCGNTASCSFRITVVDGQPPSVRCTQYTQVALGSGGESLVWASVLDAGSEDYCTSVRFKARRADMSACQAGDRFFDQLRFCCADVGKTVPVILRVYDVAVESGAVSIEYFEQQANDCQVFVQVVDKIKPACTPPAEVQVSCSHFDPSLKAYGQPKFADNCCLDAVVELPPSYAAFDTLCHRGTIVRTFRGTDCHGLSTTCTQRILVAYEAAYAIQFPDDLVLTQCDSAGLYPPGPQIFGPNCARVSLSYQDKVHQAGKLACYWIDREWTFIDWCRYHPSLPLVEVPNPTPSPDPLAPVNRPGPVVAPPGFSPAPTVQRIRPDDPLPTNFSVFWSPQANGYRYRQIIIIRDSVPPEYRGCPPGLVQVCDHTTSDPNLWSGPEWKHPLVPNSTDLCEAATDLAATAIDKCSKNNLNIQYRLFLDLDNDDIQETVVSSNNPPPAGMVRYGNAFSPDFMGGELRLFDRRPVPPEEKYRFTILRGGFVNVSGFLRWNTEKEPLQYVIPQLPHGKHRIEWIADDGCGNRTVCAYPVEVRDCRPPDLICMQGLNVSLPNGHPVVLYPQDFLLSLSDNCPPLSSIRTGIRRAGAGLGFPVLPDGSPQEDVLFDCSSLGMQGVEVWAQDVAGNSAHCNVSVRVLDPHSLCSTTPAQVAGTLKTLQNKGLQEAVLTLTGNALPGGVLTTLSDAHGDFFFTAVPTGADYILTPFKNDDPLNGVSTYDLSLLHQHIIGLTPLDHPYKIIAADVNNNRSVTTADILELRKLILGVYSSLPNNTSWRFVDADFVFPEPSNPFKTLFPEARSLSGLSAHALAEHFAAIKVGDLNGSAITGSMHTTDAAEARTYDSVTLRVRQVEASLSQQQAATFQPGEEFELLFQTAVPLTAFQATLFHPGLELLTVIPEENMLTEHFAVFEQHRFFTVAWDGAGIPAWRVRFRATAKGPEQPLYLSDAITPTAAYSGTPEALKVRLLFDGPPDASPSSFDLKAYGCEPSPWSQRAQLRFSLSQEAEVSLAISDAAGRVVFSQKRRFSAGLQRFELRDTDWPAAPGVYFFRLDTNDQSVSGKMLRQ